MKNLLERNLQHHLIKNLPPHIMKDAYLYSVLPAGKLFRPLLAQASFEDHWKNAKTQLEDPNGPLALLCSALEIHHAYTLVHDDLPYMDDDDYRRGRESTHKKFGQWQALLAGDGLLCLSLQLIQPLNYPTRRFFSWATGPRGLIFGQYMDLSQDAAKSFENMITIHKLKTARLIQVALVGGFLVGTEQFGSPEYHKAKELFKLGHALGVSFQLIDDLTELADETVGEHELAINPWIHHLNECSTELEKQIKIIKMNESSSNVSLIIENYLKKMQKKITDGKDNIRKNICNDIPTYLENL